VSPTIRDEPPLELQDVRAGRLPGRYGHRMQDVLLARLRPLLAPGLRILDAGSGRAPTLAPEDRPVGAWYVGLDVSGEELAAAPPGAYDETCVHDLTEPLTVDRPFDLALSWQVLEHVSDVGAALENLRHALRPGGTLLAQLTSSAAAFSVLGRVIPHRARRYAMARWLGHHPDEKFPLRHRRRTAGELERLLEPWAAHEIIPFYRGATYFAALRPLQRAYLAYESALERRQARGLATHYLIIAER
jgi:SAM-dependent methyltransferase